MAISQKKRINQFISCKIFHLHSWILSFLIYCLFIKHVFFCFLFTILQQDISTTSLKSAHPKMKIPHILLEMRLNRIFKQQICIKFPEREQPTANFFFPRAAKFTLTFEKKIVAASCQRIDKNRFESEFCLKFCLLF